jgi:sialic acid synthase SpsE
MGIEAAVLSVALGARVIEKHFTIDKNHSEFRDHKLSADPAELAELVRRVKEAEAMLGDGVKRVLDCERATVGLVRRTIAAGRDLAEGSEVAAADLVWLRPRGQGLAPGSEDRLVGRRLRRAVAAGQPILPEDVA